MAGLGDWWEDRLNKPFFWERRRSYEPPPPPPSRAWVGGLALLAVGAAAAAPCFLSQVKQKHRLPALPKVRVRAALGGWP